MFFLKIVNLSILFFSFITANLSILIRNLNYPRKGSFCYQNLRGKKKEELVLVLVLVDLVPSINKPKFT
jgi:hypothetical protein